jgi:signal transduction histidine kinase
MRLLPQSLTLRLFLTIAVVLSVAQLVSAVLHFQDRGQVLYHAAGLNSAERIAGMIRLLEGLPPTERAPAVAALDTPALRIALGSPEEPAEYEGEQTRHERLLQGMISSVLGPQHAVRVSEGPAGPLPEPGLVHVHPFDGPSQSATGDTRTHGMMAGMGLFLPEVVSFVAQVRLRDGTWVSFDNQVPQAVFAWPRKLLWSLLVLLVSAVAVALIAVRWLTRPLAALAQAADDLGRDIRGPPLPESGPFEVRRAAHAFNRMQARILRFLDDRSRILSAVSHDLKTPVTRLRLRAEMLEDHALKEKICRDLAEMNTMVQGALDFMRGLDSDESTQAVDINALLESLQADAQDAGHAMAIQGRAETPYLGRPLALKRCLGNLLDNAFQYGGRARVRVTDGADALHIQITDDGPGIPEPELERVFEPFYRLEASRSRQTGGTGLGLSIARNIARAHGGELTLRNAPGGGLEVCLSLPRGTEP